MFVEPETVRGGKNTNYGLLRQNMKKKKKTTWKNENVHNQNVMMFHAILSLCSSAKKLLVVTESLIVNDSMMIRTVCLWFTDPVQQTPPSAGFLQQKAPVSQKPSEVCFPKTFRVSQVWNFCVVSVLVSFYCRRFFKIIFESILKDFTAKNIAKVFYNLKNKRQRWRR